MPVKKIPVNLLTDFLKKCGLGDVSVAAYSVMRWHTHAMISRAFRAARGRQGNRVEWQEQLCRWICRVRPCDGRCHRHRVVRPFGAPVLGSQQLLSVSSSAGIPLLL